MVKAATSERDPEHQNKETITASPLDYHVFRQEITSKYPAYVPPRPAIPLEAENTSLLPPIPNQTTRNSNNNGILQAPPDAHNGGASILHQPVHIATPAPSPPPSPGVGGKGGKKQNYQTNQNFPFMYPPLDASSNSAGGKGPAGIHDALVARKWEGSDIPASILEAGELFSSRVRMTRATRQLWEEREKFLRYDRGWENADEDDDIDDLDLNELTLEEQDLIKEFKAEGKEKRPAPPPQDIGPDFGPKPERLTERDRRRLHAVENFYVSCASYAPLGCTLGAMILTIGPAGCPASPSIAGHCTIATNPGQRYGDSVTATAAPGPWSNGRSRYESRDEWSSGWATTIGWPRPTAPSGSARAHPRRNGCCADKRDYDQSHDWHSHLAAQVAPCVS